MEDSNINIMTLICFFVVVVFIENLKILYNNINKNFELIIILKLYKF